MRNRKEALYNCWRNMMTRCYDKTYHSYHRYGGRGIKVHLPWQDWQTFQADMTEGYEPGLTLDRKDNDGDYCPDNVRWLSKAENTKPFKHDPNEVLKLYLKGKTQKELAKHFGTDQPHICRLLKKARDGVQTEF